MNRRHFLWTGAALGAGAFLPTRAAETAQGDRRIFFSVKWGMIDEPKLSMVEKFQLLKDLGFDGAELDSPGGFDPVEALAASQKTGLPIHGSVDSIHWKTRLSDPDPKVRERALEGLLTALRETRAVGGSAVLVVPGIVSRDGGESPEEVRTRSIEEIRKALPTAAKLGVRILIENVWNGFLYDPKGGDDQAPDALVEYLDEIDSPWVGSYFDIGNFQRYAKPARWIRALKDRIVKVDLKDWSKNGGFKDIGEGDIDWPDVRKALREIGFTGWATAEVDGGDRKRLALILKQMKAFLLGPEAV